LTLVCLAGNLSGHKWNLPSQVNRAIEERTLALPVSPRFSVALHTDRPRLLAPPLLIRSAVSAPPRIPIAVFLTSFDSGGTDRQMTELIRRLDRGTFDALVGAVSHLFATPSLGERLGLAARRHVQDHYSLARMVSAFENLYLAELARRGYRTSVRDLERHLQTAVS